MAVRKIIADDILDRGTTVLIASHNLRELEDLCDQVGLLHGGKILFQKELAELQQDFAKIQFAAKPLPDKAAFEQQRFCSKLNQMCIRDRVGSTVTSSSPTVYIAIRMPFWRRQPAIILKSLRSNSFSDDLLEDNVVVVIADCLHFCNEDFFEGEWNALAEQRIECGKLMPVSYTHLVKSYSGAFKRL